MSQIRTERIDVNKNTGGEDHGRNQDVQEDEGRVDGWAEGACPI